MKQPKIVWSTRLLQRCTRRPSPSRPSDRCSVYGTPLLVSSLTPCQVTTSLQLQWPPINPRIVYKLCLLMHFIHTNEQPAYVAEVVASSSRSGLRSASHLMYRKSALKIKFGERSFSHAGLLPGTVCNTRPSMTQSESTLNTSKKLLKTYLFTSSFNYFIVSHAF